MSTLSLLEKLPVELIYEIQLSALSESLPIVNRQAYGFFKETHSNYRAEYIFLRYLARGSWQEQDTQGGLVSYALAYPMCNEDVLDALLRVFASSSSSSSSSSPHPPSQEQNQSQSQSRAQGSRPLLPKRLFKSLSATPSHTPQDPPLPFLRHLFTHPHLTRPPDPNAHNGYALAHAVRANHRPLVKFLLREGAKPGLKDALAVRIAVRRADLGLVRMLVEREEDEDEEDEEERRLIYNDSKVQNIVKREGSRDGAKVNAADQYGREAGSDAVPVRKKRRKSAKRRRLEDRVDITTALLRLAVESNARDIVQYFLDKGARPDMLTIRSMQRNGFV